MLFLLCKPLFQFGVELCADDKLRTCLFQSSLGFGYILGWLVGGGRGRERGRLSGHERQLSLEVKLVRTGQEAIRRERSHAEHATESTRGAGDGRIDALRNKYTFNGRIRVRVACTARRCSASRRAPCRGFSVGGDATAELR